MNPIKAIIVEDVQTAIDNLLYKLKTNCPDVEVVASCNTSELAIREIPKMKPDLVFLDIRLDTLSGFDVLSRLQQLDFEVIFTTAYDEYAIKAFKVDALDYLLKPIDENELINAVNKARIKIQERKLPLSRISVPISNGVRLLKPEQIIYCEADNNYTFIHLDQEKPVLITKTLKEIEKQLQGHHFSRIHKTYLVNEEYISAYTREDGGVVHLTNGKKLKLSRGRKDQFLKKLFSGFRWRSTPRFV